ncbi:MAG: DNA internalization-related competence protein ComEC/Rec2 [Oscillospiraceae bacterium]|nr:DNA internalization-related competence protein ComEC/Rec2 [Oscillospiraceae bacterium]
MRKLMWFTIGFTAASFLCAYFWIDTELLWLAGFFVVAFMSLMVFGREAGALRRIGAVCLGIAVGFGWYGAYASFYLRDSVNLDGNTGSVTIQCVDYGYETSYGTAVDGMMPLNNKVYRVRVYLNGKPEIEPGDIIQGEFSFRVTAPGGEKGATYHQGEGIFLLAYQQSDAKLGKISRMPFWCYPAFLREGLISLIETHFPADAAAFAKALLLGDRSDIDYATNTAFKVSGISHIVAVSGLHVSILFSLLYTLMLRRRWLVALLGIPALLLFAAVAGFTPSITRACIMQILMILALCFEREYDPPTALSFAVLAMLVVNPLVVTSISFQLSVGCMAGIFLFREPIYNWLGAKIGCDKKDRYQKLRRGFASGVAVTLSAMTLTTPLVAWYFGAVSLVGVVTNLLVLWVVSFIFYGIMLVCLAGVVWPTVAGILAAIITIPIRYVLTVSKVLAAFPLAAVYTKSVYVVAWLILCYILLLVFLCSRKRRPGLLLCCGVLGLCLALTASWVEPMMHRCRMTVLDVGQGQSIILQSEGKTYLVDCGGSDDEAAADMAAETLMSQGIFRLDGIILTHYDRDHAGGIANLLTRIPADTLFLPDAPDSDGVTAPMLALADSAMYVDENMVLSYGGTNLTIFGPARTDSDNESSLCVLFQAANCDILITGDRSDFGERLLLREAELPPLEILVAGHHGSKSSTSVELLQATWPSIVVISVGENPYGHPQEELLARLAEHGCIVYRTDEDGSITFRR